MLYITLYRLSARRTQGSTKSAFFPLSACQTAGTMITATKQINAQNLKLVPQSCNARRERCADNLQERDPEHASLWLLSHLGPLHGHGGGSSNQLVEPTKTVKCWTQTSPSARRRAWLKDFVLPGKILYARASAERGRSATPRVLARLHKIATPERQLVHQGKSASNMSAMVLRYVSLLS